MFQQFRDRNLNHKVGRLRNLGFGHDVGIVSFQPACTQGYALGIEDIQNLVHGNGEDSVLPIELLPHPWPLRPHAGIDKHNARILMLVQSRVLEERRPLVRCQVATEHPERIHQLPCIPAVHT